MRKKLSLIFSFLCFFAVSSVKAQCPTHIQETLKNTVVSYISSVNVGENGEFFIMNPYPGATYTATNITTGEVFTSSESTLFRGTHSINVGTITQNRNFLIKAVHGTCVFDVITRTLVARATNAGATLQTRIYDEYCDRGGEIMYKILGSDQSTAGFWEPVTNDDYDFYRQQPDGSWGSPIDPNGTSGLIGGVNANTAQSYKIRAVKKSDPTKTLEATVSITNKKQAINASLREEYGQCDAASTIRVIPQNGLRYPLYFTLVRVKDLGGGQVEEETIISRQTSPYFTGIERKTDGMGNGYKVYVTDGCSAGNTNSFEIALQHFKPTEAVHYDFYGSPHNVGGCDVGYMNFYQRIRITNKTSFAPEIFPYPFTFSYKFISPSGIEYPYTHTFNNREEMLEFFEREEEYPTVKKRLYTEIPAETGVWTREASYTVCGQTYPIATITREMYKTEDRMKMFARTNVSTSTDCQRQQIVGEGAYAWAHSNMNMYYILKTFPPCYNPEADGWVKNSQFGGAWTKAVGTNNNYVIVSPTKIAGTDEECVGTYTFDVANSCGDRVSQHITSRNLQGLNSSPQSWTNIEATTNKPVTQTGTNAATYRTYGSCSANYNFVRQIEFYNDVVDKIELVSYTKHADVPATVNLPADITIGGVIPTSYKKAQVSWVIDEMPAGSYRFKLTKNTSCGIVEKELVFSYSPEIDDKFKVEQVGCNWVIKRETRTGTLAPRVYYVLQWFNKETGRWEDPHTTNNNQYNADNISATGVTLNSSTGLYSYGKYRIARMYSYLQSFYSPTCVKPIPGQEFELKSSEPLITNIVGLDCNDSIYQVAVMAESINTPLTYKITNIAGVEIAGGRLSDAGNMFFSLQVTNANSPYTFQVTDACGLQRVRIITPGEWAGNLKITPDKEMHCSNNSATLSVPDLGDAFSYEWYREDAPNNILGRTHKLEIASLTAADFANRYKVRLKNASTNTSARQCINKEVDYQFKTDPALTPLPDISAMIQDVEICALPIGAGTYDVLKNLFKDAPIGGELYVEETLTYIDASTSTNASQRGRFYINLSSYAEGEYTFVYTIKDICGNQSQAKAKLTRKPQLASPPTSNNAQTINICSETENPTFAQIEAQYRAKVGTFLDANTQLYWYRTNNNNIGGAIDDSVKIVSASDKANSIYTAGLPAFGTNAQLQNSYLYVGVLPEVGSKYCESEPIRITISRYKMPATLANTSLAVCEPYTFTEVARDLAEKLKVGTTNLNATWFKFYKVKNGVETEIVINTAELENDSSIAYKFRYNQNNDCLSVPYDLTVTFNNRPSLRQTTAEQLTLCNLTVGEARAKLQQAYPNSTIFMGTSLQNVTVNGVNIPTRVLNVNLITDASALTEGSTYYFTYQNTGEICASQVGTFVATKSNVKPAPVSDLNFCHNENISALVARLSGTNIKLYRQVGSTYTLVDASTYNTTKLVAGERFFYTTTPAGTTCESEKAQITYALANPSAPALKTGTSNKICATSTTEMYSLAQLVEVPTGYELVWYKEETGGAKITDMNEISVDRNVTAEKTFTRWAALKTLATGTPASCEGTARTKVEVEINFVPLATLNANTREFCPTTTSTLVSLADFVNAPATGYELVWYKEETGGTKITDMNEISVDRNVTAERIFTRWVAQRRTATPNCESLTRTEVSVKIKFTAAPTGNATQIFCGSATISNLTATGTNIKWYEVATGGTALDANTALTNGTTYYASQTLNDCESLTRLAVQVTIETPSAPTLNANTREFCPTTTSTLVSLADFVNAPATGYELVWYNAATGGTKITDMNEISVDKKVTAEKIFTRWVAQKRTATPNCESARTKVEVTIKDETAPVISGTTDKTLDCNDPNFDTEVTNWIDAVTARDACVGTTTVTHNYTKPADLCNTRSISVTFTSTDTFGNTTTTTGTITLVNIDAVNDSKDNVDSIAGGDDILDVLTNDTLNGNPATINDVTISVETAATPINGGSVPTLNPATGKVSVPAGTPAGEYEIEYQICDKQNTGICDKAKVTIKVVAPTITAVDNNYLVSDNSQNFESTTDILDNDLLGTNPATTANVAITQLSTTNNGVNIDPATGKVKVDANTPAGTYVIAYKICDKVNATNCTDAKVYVKVLDRNIPTTITAVNDNYVVPNGDTGATVGKIYDNDQVNGNTPTETSVTLTVDSIKDGNNQPSTQIEVKPNGDIEVKPNTPAGVYTIQYTICDKAATPSCSTAIVKVVVNTPTTTVPTTNLPKIVALPDEYNVTDPTQDTNNIGNILANDSSTAGTTPTTADTSLTINSVKDKDGNDASGKVIVNANGSVDVKANTPAGEYTVVYTICDRAQTNVCSTSTAKVIVPAPSITAVDNNYLVSDNSQNFESTTDILDNDLLGTNPATTTNVAITQLSTTNNGVNIDPATGKVKVDANTPAGTYVIAYKICDKVNTTNCTEAKVYVKVLDKTIPTTITAVNDNYVVPNGDTGATVGKIYDNDQVNGNTPTETSVTLTVDSIKDGDNQPSTQIEVKPNGDIEVKPNTPAGVYTIQYTICDKATTPSCSTAIVKVVVNTPTTTVPTTNLPKIVALPDEYKVTDPTQDTNNIGNILANDSSTAGTTPDASNTTLTINSVKDKDGNDASGKVIVNANGSVDVKANTPAGEYTVVYTICDNTQTNVCSTSTAKVIVPAPSITAVDNNYLVSDNSQNFESTTDILDNDLLGTNPATTTNVAITQLSTTNNGVNIDPATGKVKVDANTPAGTYVIAYKICDKVNTTNCTEAKVYVKVLDRNIPTTITAVNDNYVVPNGDTGATVGKIYDNDQVNGNTPTETSVTLTVDSIKDGDNQPSTQIEVKPNGDIEVKPNTPAGVYTIQYTICDKAATPSCSTAIVKVVVNTPTTTVPTTNLPKIVALPDEYKVTDPTQDTNNIGNILTNDSSTAGTTPTTADTSLTINSVKDKDGNDASTNIKVNTDGSVDVKANTPAGEYTVVYTICDNTQTNVCSTSTAKVIVPAPTVVPPVIVATPNTFTITDSTKGGVTPSILDDDDLGGRNPNEVEIKSTPILDSSNNPSTGITVNTDGTVTVAPNTPAGTYTFEYSVCDIATGVCSKNVQVTIVVEAKGCELEFYNAISKNDDNINDTFVIKGIECYPDNTLKIFNRWGVLVFEQNGYRNNFIGYSNGRVVVNKDEELPQGTYYYIFEYKDSEGKSNRRAGWLYKR